MNADLIAKFKTEKAKLSAARARRRVVQDELRSQLEIHAPTSSAGQELAAARRRIDASRERLSTARAELNASSTKLRLAEARQLAHKARASAQVDSAAAERSLAALTSADCDRGMEEVAGDLSDVSFYRKALTNELVRHVYPVCRLSRHFCSICGISMNNVDVLNVKAVDVHAGGAASKPGSGPSYDQSLHHTTTAASSTDHTSHATGKALHPPDSRHDQFAQRSAFNAAAGKGGTGTGHRGVETGQTPHFGGSGGSAAEGSSSLLHRGQGPGSEWPKHELCAAALGYVVDLVQIIAAYYSVTLPHSLEFKASHSVVWRNSACSGYGSDMEECFPLYPPPPLETQTLPAGANPDGTGDTSGGSGAGGGRHRSSSSGAQERTKSSSSDCKGSTTSLEEEEETHNLFFAGVALLNADIHHLCASAVWAGPHHPPRHRSKEEGEAPSAPAAAALAASLAAAADMVDYDQVSARSPIANTVRLVEVLCGASAVPKAWLLAGGEGGRPVLSPGSPGSSSPNCDSDGAGTGSAGGNLLRFVKGPGEYGDGPDSDLGDLQWDADVAGGGFEIVDFPLPPTPSSTQTDLDEWEMSNR